MGLKETTRAIRRFVGDRKSFIEIVAGPSLAEVIHIEDSTVAYPLGSLGNDAAINFGVRLLNGLGVPTDQGFVSEAQRQGEPFYGLTAIVYAGLSDAELDLAVKASSRHTDRVRAVLSFYTAGNHTILIRFKWAEATRGGVEFVAPPYRRGVQSRHEIDPISVHFLKLCMTDRLFDDRLHYFIEMLTQSHGLDDEQFRIARLFSILESLAGPITGQFELQGHKSVTRTAIRFMLGCFVNFDIPRFTVEPNDEFEFDHIELAGRLRDKIFHGGGTLGVTDVSASLQPGLDLLRVRPDMISHQLRKDCELEISRWATGESRARQASEGTKFQFPQRDPNYSGKSLAKPLISCGFAMKSAIVSIWVQVVGGDSGVVRLNLQF